jgi:Carboxypeptidase regulatory-like domain
VTVRAGANTTTTNSSGVYHFFNLPVGSYSVTASATGFTSKTVNGVSVTDRATTTRNFALQPSGSPIGNLTGTVTNAANGTPVANVTVRAGANTTTTNSSGVYHFFNLPAGSYSVTASATGFTSKTVNSVSVTNGATTTLNFALQPTGGSPGSTKALVPIIVKAAPPTPTPTPTPRCDPYEPNDNRSSNPFGPIASGQVYLAKLCHDDSEDNYYFVTATQNQIQITLHLPPALVGHTLLWVYAQADLRQGHEICSSAPVTKADTVLLCSIPHPGGYDLRIYTDGVFDDLNSYSFAVNYQ